MRIYDILLRLYPTSFRAEYGEEIRAIWARRARDASGPPAAAALWIATVFEVLFSAASVHWDIFRQDLRYTVRTLARSPGFALTAILVLAMGVGANTAAFSVTDFVLIRPLPFPEPGRLVTLWEKLPGYPQMELSPSNYADWKRMSKSFDGMGAYWKALSTWWDRAPRSGSAGRRSPPICLRYWACSLPWGACSRPRRTAKERLERCC